MHTIVRGTETEGLRDEVEEDELDEAGFYAQGWQPAVIGGKGDDEGRVFILADTSELYAEVSLSKREALVLAKDLVLQVVKEAVGL